MRVFLETGDPVLDIQQDEFAAMDGHLAIPILLRCMR